MKRKTLGLTSNPPAVEKTWTRPVDINIHIDPAPAEVIENRSTFNKERSFLFVVSLIGSKVNNRRINFHLAKIRIDAHVEIEIAFQPNLKIKAGIA